MEFKVPKKLSLKFLGDAYNESYINFALPSLEEGLNEESPSEEEMRANPKKYTKLALGTAEKQFMDGKVWNGSQLVDIQASDIKKLPPSVFIEATKLLNGVIDPNS